MGGGGVLGWTGGFYHDRHSEGITGELMGLKHSNTVQI